MCRRDLAGALHQLADQLERGEISTTLWSFQGNGMVQDWRCERLLMTRDLAAAPARKSTDASQFIDPLLSP